jgi:hypothetical protein
MSKLDKFKSKNLTAKAADDNVTQLPASSSSTRFKNRSRKRESETFARVLHDRAIELYPHRVGGAAWQVLIELDRLILTQHGQNPVRLWSPRLYAIGLTKHTRTRALRQLENAGAVKIEHYDDGKGPLVLHLWYERCDVE